MTQFRWFSAGESHGPSMLTLVEGIPAGLDVSVLDINKDLAARQRGYGRSGRMKIEHDEALIESGIRHGKTLGSPIAVRVINKDHERWLTDMSANPVDSAVIKPVTTPRPGHADLAGALKYNQHDVRNILERASARSTVSTVVAGSIARIFLRSCNIAVISRVVSIGDAIDERVYETEEIQEKVSVIEQSSLRAIDPVHEEKMVTAIKSAAHNKDTLGGMIEIIAVNVPVGLGSNAQWDSRLDGKIAQAMMSIPAIKAVEIGDGWSSARQSGSTVHDPIGYDHINHKFIRSSNHAGGIESGMSNGEAIVVRIAMKPLPTLGKPLASVDVVTKENTQAFFERSDICAVPSASVIAQASLALVVAGAMLDKFGSDAITEFHRNLAGYRTQLEQY